MDLLVDDGVVWSSSATTKQVVDVRLDCDFFALRSVFADVPGLGPGWELVCGDSMRLADVFSQALALGGPEEHDFVLGSRCNCRTESPRRLLDRRLANSTLR